MSPGPRHAHWQGLAAARGLGREEGRKVEITFPPLAEAALFWSSVSFFLFSFFLFFFLFVFF